MPMRARCRRGRYKLTHTMSQNPAAAEVPFSVLPSLLKRFDKIERQLAYEAKDKSSHAKWRKVVLKKLHELTGFDTFEKCPLKPKITEDVQLDGYRRQRVEIQTEPGVVMPFYVLIPDGATGRTPAVINPHGHASGGKLAPAGVADDPLIRETIATYNYDYGVQYARAGLIVFCPDARGFGERQEKEAKA